MKTQKIYQKATASAHIPLKFIGPMKIVGDEVNTDVKVPLATFESPLWPSTQRGARLSTLAGGIQTTIVRDGMTRSILLQADSATQIQHCLQTLQQRRSEVAAVIAGTSRFAQLTDWHAEIIANLLFFRITISSGDASGHNMVTKAADALMHWLLTEYPQLQHVSVSGNYCTDKKVSAVNGILGRGKHVIAEITIDRELCEKRLRCTPEQLVALNIKKNLIGSHLAGSVRSANAHFANMLLAFYLATGQDAANIVEGSQGISYAEVRADELYFSVTLPNIIVGTVGNGKDLEFVRQNLAALGCDVERPPGQNARRLAIIAAATVLCGELSLLAAQTNPGELTKSHMKLERMTQTQRNEP